MELRRSRGRHATPSSSDGIGEAVSQRRVRAAATGDGGLPTCRPLAVFDFLPNPTGCYHSYTAEYREVSVGLEAGTAQHVQDGTTLLAPPPASRIPYFPWDGRPVQPPTHHFFPLPQNHHHGAWHGTNMRGFF
ncbi:hypothetical protein SEVIR_5G446051v4 [Setaria viridis]